MRAATITAIVTESEDLQALAPQAGRRLVGFSLSEAADEPDAASFVLRHGDEEGTPIGWFSLAAGGTQTVVISDRGVAVDDGVFIELVDGEVAISLWHTTG